MAKAKEQAVEIPKDSWRNMNRSCATPKRFSHQDSSQEQVADSLKNLSRATEQVKQGEEVRAKLLAEAAEKGFKPSDLREEAPR